MRLTYSNALMGRSLIAAFVLTPLRCCSRESRQGCVSLFQSVWWMTELEIRSSRNQSELELSHIKQASLRERS